MQDAKPESALWFISGAHQFMTDMRALLMCRSVKKVQLMVGQTKGGTALGRTFLLCGFSIWASPGPV